jgi:hypothetical protein
MLDAPFLFFRIPSILLRAKQIAYCQKVFTMTEIRMPHNLPEPKEVKFHLAGKDITVGASVLPAGDDHPWARKNHPVVVLKPLGEDLGRNNEARELLGGSKHRREIRDQAIEQLREKLGGTNWHKRRTEIVVLGAGIR